MSDIDEYERRISAALDRVARGLEAMPSGGGGGGGGGAADAEALARVTAELEDERLANAQLEERVKAIREKQDSHVARLEGQLEAQTEAMSKLDSELQRMKTANAQLREVGEALRAIATEGVAEPHLINKAMLSELEALRAARGVEAAEAGAILSALVPLIEAPEADDAPEEEQADA